MSDNELKDTQPNTVKTEAAPPPRKKFPGWLAGLVLIVFIAVGILGGYASGMGQRYAAQSTQVSGQLLEQYQLGVQAVNAGQYSVAKQHFEYIIQNYPDYPGIKSAYTDLLLHMMITPSEVPLQLRLLPPRLIHAALIRFMPMLPRFSLLQAWICVPATGTILLPSLIPSVRTTSPITLP